MLQSLIFIDDMIVMNGHFLTAVPDLSAKIVLSFINYVLKILVKILKQVYQKAVIFNKCIMPIDLRL